MRLGVKTGRGVLDVAMAATAFGDAETPVTPHAFFAAGLAALPRLAALVQRAESGASADGLGDAFLDETELTFGPCVVAPEKIICVGRNYVEHAAESGSAVPETPMLFSKFNNALAGHREDVPLRAIAERYDYEAELAVVIGRRAQDVNEDAALDYVLGYCNANDLSARELQRRTSQFLLGKSLDKFLPIGPYLVTADEVPDPQALRVRCWVDGDLRQDASTADMVFTVRHLVSYASRYFTLEPGDIICTGTPAGVIMGHSDPQWLRPGQEVTVEVEGLGRLTNRLVAG